MKIKPFIQSILVVVFLSSLTLSACSSGGSTAQSTTAQPVKIKFAALRILDLLPVYVAQQEGYFAHHGVEVEIVPVNSAPERDQLLAAGQVDGVINEALSAMLMNKTQTQVQVVRYARAATSTDPLFRILASSQSGITKPDQLKGVEVGISNATVIEYLNDRLLKAEGLTAAEIKTIAVPSLSDRLALLNSGQLKAGMLPDPQASLAISQGAVDVLDDTSHPEYSFSTMTFRKETIDQHPDAVRGFLAGVEDAVTAINQNGAAYKQVLIDQKILPDAIKDSFAVPSFVTAGVPSEGQYADMLAWARNKGLLTQDVAYQTTVTADYLPK
jgi:NitT/TauT family transport system substrate-binding protein